MKAILALIVNSQLDLYTPGREHTECIPVIIWPRGKVEILNSKILPGKMFLPSRIQFYKIVTKDCVKLYMNFGSFFNSFKEFEQSLQEMSDNYSLMKIQGHVNIASKSDTCPFKQYTNPSQSHVH